MEVRNLVLQSIQPIIENSQFVRINQSNLKKLAKELLNSTLPQWEHDLQYIGNASDTIQYYFLLDSINFCFWPPIGKEKWAYHKDGVWLSGYYAYSYAIKKAIENNPSLLNANYLSNISYKEFKQIFKGKGKLQLLKKRHNIIIENFRILNSHFKGQALELVRLANQDVNSLIKIILNNFPTFQDFAYYKGEKVYFLKRPQIFVSDIYFAFENMGLAKFTNINNLTVFADYKLPQLLEANGVLEYEKSLQARIKIKDLIKQGSKEEIEIRANTI